MTRHRKPAHGLPHALPADERILWQGRPDALRLARSAFGVRLWLAYAVILIAGILLSALAGSGGLSAALGASLLAGALLLASVAMLFAFALLAARSTIYTITTKRVVIGYGATIEKFVNLPYRRIAAAALRRGPRGTGDIALTPERGTRLSYLLLWPHARPGGRGSVQPTLRAVRDADRVATLLAGALAGALTASEATLAPAATPTAARDIRGATHAADAAIAASFSAAE